MKAGRLIPGARQWELFQELQRRPEGMTSLEAVRFLAEQGICSIDVRDDLATIRKGAAAYGWRLLPAEPVRTSDSGSRVYRYRLVPTALLAPAAAPAQAPLERTQA